MKTNVLDVCLLLNMKCSSPAYNSYSMCVFCWIWNVLLLRTTPIPRNLLHVCLCLNMKCSAPAYHPIPRNLLHVCLCLNMNCFAPAYNSYSKESIVCVSLAASEMFCFCVQLLFQGIYCMCVFGCIWNVLLLRTTPSTRNLLYILHVCLCLNLNDLLLRTTPIPNNLVYCMWAIG